MIAHTQYKFDSVIFGQLSMKRPNAGKLMQQMMVLFLYAATKIMNTNLEAQLAIL